MSSLLDILDSDLSTEESRIIVQRHFDAAIESSINRPSPSNRITSLAPAKNLYEFFDMVRVAIKDYHDRAGTPEELRALYTEEEPDVDSETETITFGVTEREPGSVSRGAPGEGKVKNYKFITREIYDDPDNPGYRKAILGYLHDNHVVFTCWARTNKAANKRAIWFEDLMEDYMWWFTSQGLQRVLYYGQGSDLVVTVNGNKWYGRPIRFFVRTEKLKAFDEKKLEEIYINLVVKKSL